MIEAELSDGTILEFPDGTDSNVIRSVVAAHTQQRDQESLSTGEIVTGAANALGTFASAAVAEPISGLAGLASIPFVGADKSGDVVRSVQDSLTVEPRGRVAPKILGAVGDAVNFVSESPPGQFIGDLVEAHKRISEANGFFKDIAPGVNHALAEIGPVVLLEAAGFVGINALRGAKRVSGITDEVEDDLKRNNVDIDALSEKEITSLQDVVSADIAAFQKRQEVFESVGINEPTKAQISRRADDFQSQQEAAKTSSRVRDTLEGQEAVLSEGFDRTVFGAGGDKVTPGSTAIDEVVDRSTKLDREISDLYQQARDAAPGEKNVALGNLSSLLKQKAPSNTATSGLIESVVGDLKARGVLDDNFKVVGRIDVETAEEVRKFINSHHNSTSDFGRGVMRELKEALDRDVFSSAGRDVFDKARKAKADFESGLNRAKVSKFDKRRTNLVRDMIENKLDPDEFAAKITQTKSYRAQDLKQLKDYLEQTPSGKTAWDDLRAETLESIKTQTFIGPDDADGFKALSRAKLETVLNKIGRPRRDILFSVQENQFLDRMLEVSKLREPVRGTAIGRGPSAQAVSALQAALSKSKILSALVEAITLDAQGRAVLKARIPDAPKLRQIEDQTGGVIAASAIGAADLSEQSNTQ